MLTVILWALLGYVICGLLALLVFDLITGRIRSRLKDSADDARHKLITSGTAVGVKESVMLVVLALWLFWPAVFIGAVIPDKKAKDKGGQL